MKIFTKIIVALILMGCVQNAMSSTRMVKDYSERAEILVNLKERVQQHFDYLDDARDSVLVRSIDPELESENLLRLTLLQNITQELSHILTQKQSLAFIKKRNDFLRLDTPEKHFFVTQSEEAFSKTFNIMFQGFMDIRLQYLHRRKINTPEREALQETVGACWEEINDLTEKMSIDTYQTLNTVIVGLASFVDLQTLPKETQKWMRLSPSLWQKIVDGQADDYGHPDDAIVDFQDVDLYEKNILKIMPDRKIRSESVLCPLFGAMLPVAPPQLHEEATLDENTPTILKKKKKKKKPTKKTGGVSLTIENMREDAEHEDVEHEDGISAIITESPEEMMVETITAKFAATIPLEESDEGLFEETEFAEFMDPGALHLLHQEKKALKRGGDLIETAEILLEDRGEMPTHHRDTYDSVMSPTFSTILYSDFCHLWRYLGGEVGMSGGGSHRALIFNGKKVGGTFEPHGGHNYGPRCVKYLRAALEKIPLKFA